MDTEQIPQPAPSSVGTDISVAVMMRDLETREHEQNAEAQDQFAIGESLMDILCFKYTDMPAGKHIHVRELEHNLMVVSVSHSTSTSIKVTNR